MPTGGQEIQPFFAPELIRIFPERIVSFGINAEGFATDARSVDEGLAE